MTAAQPPADAAADLVPRIQRAWQDVLATDAVALDVSFFDAGGNSLLLIMLLDELSLLTDRRLSAAELFRYDTVRRQALLLSGADEDRQPTARGATQRHRLLGVARRPRAEGAGQ